jgi:acyl-coenzyme A thioesterase PaaI-like protein
LTSESRIVAVAGVPAFEFEEHNCFACGSLNEHGLGMTIHIDHGRAWSELGLEPRFEGWAGVAHGGILATLLDEVMGWTMAAGDEWGVTARLNIEYRKPVEPGTPLRIEGWITRNRRRLAETAGRVLDARDGTELVTATATYALVGEARKQELRTRYGIRRLGTGSETPEPVAR